MWIKLLVCYGNHIKSTSDFFLFRKWDRKKIKKNMNIPLFLLQIYTITPLVKRTGPVSEMEKLAHKAVGPHQYMYEDERN